MGLNKHYNKIWGRIEELQSEGEISLRLLPPHGLTLIDRSGNVLEVYVNDELAETYSEVSEAFYDELVEEFDSAAIKMCNND